jgi:hypothetical protein
MLLGYTYNKTLQDIFSSKRPDLSPIRSINGLPARARAIFIGRVEDTYKGKSKNGNKYFKAVVSDETGLIPALIFRDQMDKCESANSGFPQKNNIVIVKGTKADGAIFADVISVQDTQVYTKLSELKAIKS